MSDSSLETLARATGIATRWTDAFGQPRDLSSEALHGLLDALRVPARDEASRRSSLRMLEERERASPALITADTGGMFELPPSARGTTSIDAYDEQGAMQTLWKVEGNRYRAPAAHGYYQLDVGAAPLTLAVAPQRCFSVGDCLGMEKQRAWGLAAQVYSLRHADDGGLGDSRAVAQLAEAIGHAGGGALALSPLHAMSPVGAHYSPYSPSHRGFLNWLHADPAQVFGEPALRAAIEGSGVAATWQQAHQGKLIDWRVAYALRRNVFRTLYEQLAHAQPTLRDDLQRFIAQGGDALRQQALLAARQARASLLGQAVSWRAWDDWPEESTRAVFGRSHQADVDFEAFLQWLAARCWDKTAAQAREAGQRIGLVWDLAVGFEPGGGEAWAWRDQILQGLELGAPPDAFNPDGQRWGITTYAPWGLKSTGFRPFIELLRANMARAGGLRIDHIIGFQHVWALPEGGASTAGGYIRQPLEDLLRLTALESWRHRCIVIGEDLGTVPEGLRDRLAARGILGIDVLLFTHDEHGGFLAPERWRSNAVATTTTHDLPPLAAWRDGLDIVQTAKAHDWNASELAQHTQARAADAARLSEALPAVRTVGNADAQRPSSRYFAHLSRTPAALVLLPIEDALDLTQQPNLPGTVDTHPNWRHRLPENTLHALQPVLRELDQRMKEALPA